MIAFLERLPPGGTPAPPNAGDDVDDDSSDQLSSLTASASDDLTPVLRSLDLHHCVVDPSRYSNDFGGIYHSLPAAALRPTSAIDVARAIHLARSSQTLTLAPRGNGHCVAGQAMAGPSGAVLDMSGLATVDIHPSGSHVWAGAGALWGAVLERCLLSGRRVTPRSWTDYLGLTVGGTLSNGGVSGQAFLHGPQTSNVDELEVVTGNGEILLCSEQNEPELFFAALGGLGQFGVITRARIPLYPSPLMARWIRLVYSDFKDYKVDIESLVARPGQGHDSFDYVEGFAFVNNDDPINGWISVPLSPNDQFDSSRLPLDAGPLLYCIELALHHDNVAEVSICAREQLDKRMEAMIGNLKYVRGLEFIADVGYLEFLTRVNGAEAAAKSAGTWDAPHPWLNLFVSASDIVDFEGKVFKGVLRQGIGGPMLVYPLLRSKWDSRTSVALPENEVFYLVALLRFNHPFPEGPSLDALLLQNQEIIKICDTNKYNYKIYIPHYKNEEQWKRHFGNEWQRLVKRKVQFDPLAILAPGQRIFTRIAQGPM